MHHPTEMWYLAQAKLDDTIRGIDRARLPRKPRPDLQERVAWHRLHRRPSPRVAAAAGAGLPMGCCA